MGNLHEIQLFDQLIQIERIICQYFRKDDPSLSLKLSGCQERLDLLERTKQRVVNHSSRDHALTKDYGKSWCGRLLHESPIFMMPCCCRPIHLTCFERWVQQLRADASESYVICGITNHFYTGRRTCQCGSEIARFADPKAWMEQQDKLRKDEIAGVNVGDEGWLTNVPLPGKLPYKSDYWKDMRQDFMP